MYNIDSAVQNVNNKFVILYYCTTNLLYYIIAQLY